MRLPHELQSDRINHAYSIKQAGVERVGGLQMLKEKIVEVRAVAEFSGETFVPTDNYELLRRIGRSAADGLAERPAIRPDLLPQVWEITTSIAGVVQEKFDWWSGLRARCDELGFDMDNFMEPPVDVLRIASKDRPELVFDFLNFGLTRFSDEEIESARTIFSRALSGVDLSTYNAGVVSVVIVPSATSHISRTNLINAMDEDILKRFGSCAEDNLKRHSNMVRRAFFGATTDIDEFADRIPEVEAEVVEYVGEWGLKPPSGITFEVVEIS